MSFRSISVMCSQCLRKGKELQRALVGDHGAGVSTMISPTAKSFLFFRKDYTLIWVAWEKLLSGVSMRGKEICCTVDDVHDICSFVSRLVVLGFVCLFGGKMIFLKKGFRNL